MQGDMSKVREMRSSVLTGDWSSCLDLLPVTSRLTRRSRASCLGLNQIRPCPSIHAIHVHVHVGICIARVPAEVSPSRESSTRTIYRGARVIADKGSCERDVWIR